MAATWSPKVGDSLFSAHAECDDTGKCSVSINEWVVRTIQSRKAGQKTGTGPALVASLIQKNEFTWVKEKGKSQQFAWAAQIDSVWRQSHPVGANPPYGLYTTKRQALVAQIASVKERTKRRQQHGLVVGDELAICEAQDARLIAVINSRITRLANEAKVKRNAKGPTQ